MSEKKKIKPFSADIGKFKIAIISGFAVIVAVSIIAVSILSVKKTDSVLKNKVISLTSSLNVQMKLNLDSYLQRMEKTGTLAFGEPETYKYDATDPDNDEYEALNTEKIISDKLYSLCIMENFVDYGIVYSNNRTIGKISNGTASLFGEDIYKDLRAMVSRTRTNDGWSTGYKNDFRRIYYVKEIHENALLVISFYATELEDVFDNPETLSDMKIRLVNKDYNIIYAEEWDEIGTPLLPKIKDRIEDKNSASVMDNDYLVTINSCGYDWYVISSIKTQVILKEKNDMRIYIYAVALTAAVLAALLGAWLSVKLTRPVTNIVSVLDTKAHIDQLTGILNKRSFEDYAQNRLSVSNGITRHAVIIIDLDNFKGVNDTLGHAYGDRVLANTGNILRSVFSSDDILGRIGGDEFCVLVNYIPRNEKDFSDYVHGKCRELCEAFSNNYTGDDGKYKISASIGVSLYPMHGKNFGEMYSSADTALYHSKKSGKDTYTFYEENMKGGGK
ncbi:MAG: GGDEF domain-containing protein [Ruminococcus sp.]|nr:GGDEF domain-containing protein [Ruminococcus sp.]